MRTTLIALAAAIALCVGCASTARQADDMAPAACAMSADDRAWIDRSLEVWRFTRREITHLARVPMSRVVFSDATCALTSANALTSETGEGVTWSASSHNGQIPLPGGGSFPVGVISAAFWESDPMFLVMSVPSVWRAHGLDRGGALALEDMMTSVLLHEGSHIGQYGPYGPRINGIIERYNLPDSFNDDLMQEQFRADAEFAAAIARETEALYAAAAAQEDGEARRLAREVRAQMRARQQRWFVGEHAYFVEVEDVSLTLEGSGQWAGYQWLTHPQGRALPDSDVMPGFQRGAGAWSQAQGFALALLVDRIVGPSWKDHAFGDGRYTLLEMLDAALES